MGPYLAIVGARMRLLFQYRGAAFAGIATQVFWGLMHVMIFRAFYAEVSTTAELPMTLDQAITYTWLVQAFLVFLPWNIDREVEHLVRSGNIVYELVRPIHLYSLLFSRALAWRVGPGMLRIFPILFLSYLISNFQGPISSVYGVLFLVSLCAAIFLSTAMTALMMIVVFWNLSSAGILRLMAGLVIAFSGMQVPLAFYPEWMQPILTLLPFRGLMDTPFRIYLGQMSAGNALFGLAHQIFWGFAIILIGHWVLRQAQKKLVIQGG